MSELRRALEAIIRITNVIPSTYRTEAIAEIANTARAALSNSEAGEAALAGAWEKGREAGIAENTRYNRGLLTTKTPNPYKIPTVNGTDEPPNAGNPIPVFENRPTGYAADITAPGEALTAILAGVIPSAGRTDAPGRYDVERAIRHLEGHLTGDEALRVIPKALAALRCALEKPLREAGGRVELVERAE